jgi:hypothetical protein
MAAIRKQCPDCKVTLMQFRWSKLWWMSSMLSGRLVQPCAECGVLLRLSSMTLFTALASVGFAITSVALIVTRHPMLLIAMLVCAVLILVGALGARVGAAAD